jgi:hypothetical protein
MVGHPDKRSSVALTHPFTFVFGDRPISRLPIIPNNHGLGSNTARLAMPRTSKEVTKAT